MLTEQVAVGRPTAHNKCHVHVYEDDLQVSVKCKLEQYGAERGFLHCDEDATFTVEVCLEGHMVDHLCFDLCVAVHTECYGPQDPDPLPSKEIRHEPCNDVDNCYQFVWDIPAGYFCPPDEDDCGQVCCFATTVTSRTLCDEPGHIGCMCRGPCVMIHRKPAGHDDDDNG